MISIRRSFAPIAVCVLAAACGVALSVSRVSDSLTQESGSLFAISFCVVVALVAFRSRLFRETAGPGGLLALVGLAVAFFLGLAGGDYRDIAQRDDVAVYFAIGIAALFVGLISHRGFIGRRPVQVSIPTGRSPLRSTAVTLAAWGAIGLSAINLITGDIPLLSSSVDEGRFQATPGIFATVFIFLLAGTQFVLLLVGTTWVRQQRRPPVADLALLSAACLVLVALASRAFFASVALALVIAAATLGRIGLRRLGVFAVAGVVALGLAGQARIANSDPTGSKRAFLEQHGYDGLTGLIVQSSATGPYVFGETLTKIPAVVPHQHGLFLLRDFEAQAPTQPFGPVDRSDLWVSKEILELDVLFGSPPTLVGGLYIDFGLPGIVIGCWLIGFALAAIYRWQRRVGTIGSLALYTYFAGYIALSAYSYLSVKPLTITVLILAYAVHRTELAAVRRGATPHPARDHSNHVMG